MKIVPLVVYENGTRKVIGEAVIEQVGGSLDISATVDSRFAKGLLDPSVHEFSIDDTPGFSIGSQINQHKEI